MTTLVDREFLALQEEFPLRPIRSRRQLRRAGRVLSRLTLKAKRSRAESDYVAVLRDLVAAYEDREIPVPRLPEAEALSSLLEANELETAELAKRTSIPARSLDAVLDGFRSLQREEVETLCAHFRVEPGLFIPVGGGAAGRRAR